MRRWIAVGAGIVGLAALGACGRPGQPGIARLVTRGSPPRAAAPPRPPQSPSPPRSPASPSSPTSGLVVACPCFTAEDLDLYIPNEAGTVCFIDPVAAELRTPANLALAKVDMLAGTCRLAVTEPPPPFVREGFGLTADEAHECYRLAVERCTELGLP